MAMAVVIQNIVVLPVDIVVKLLNIVLLDVNLTLVFVINN